MLIDDVDALKSWLAKLLEPICDADPSALANYVVALVKKDKPEKELKAFCADQLDVFLQKETSGFVDKLFESLYTKNYLPPLETAKPEPKPTVPDKGELKVEVFQEAAEEERDVRKKKYSSPQKIVSESSERRTREKKREDGKWREYDRYYERSELYRDKYDWRRGRSKSRSKSRGLSRSRSRSRGRSKDRDPNRNVEHRERSKFKSERNDLESSYVPASAPPSNSSEQYSSGAQSIPSTVTVIAPAHHPENTTESWSNYYNNHSSSNSFGRNPPPKRRCRDYDERGFCVLGDLCQFDHGNDPLVVDEVALPSMIPFPPPPPGLPPPPPPGILLPPLPGPGPGPSPGPVPGPGPGSGHNMRLPVAQGHGQPPPSVVLPVPRPPITQSSLINNRDQPGTSAVPNIVPVGARLPPPLPQNLLYTVSERQPMYSREHGAAASERLQLGTPPPLLAARLVPPRNLMGSSIGYHTSVSSPAPLVPDTYEPDGYNPEAPSITSSGRSQYRQFFSRTQTQRPNLIGLTSGDMDANPRAANIVIQTEPPAPVPINSNITRVVLEPDSRKRAMSSLEGPLAKKPWMGKQGNNNQSKPAFLRKNQYTNTKLEVRKIPQELNNITKLNEHFCKFGTIVNIQVAFKGDPEAALIQYLTNDEARKAISSTEAVLNNRFIRVLWHRDSSEQQSLPLASQQLLLHQQQQSPSLPHLPQQHLHPQQALASPSPPSAAHGGVPKVMAKPQGPATYVLNKVPIKHRLGPASGNQGDGTHLLNQSGSAGDDSQTFSTLGHTKMVYSSTNLKTTSKSGAGTKSHDVHEALKKKQEAMKLQQDMRKKRQEMLEKQIECQKMLISKLEKNKNMKPEERANIMKTLKELGEKISQLKDELKTSSTASAPSKVKSKTEAQKELLDAEMDFHKRLSSGEDTTELRKKLNQLQVEAARLGILPIGRGKTTSSQGRGRGRGRGARGRGSLNHMVVDHRPKALTIAGFIEEEKDELLQHFSKFGDIEDLQEEDSPLSVVLTFKSRSEAENAANQGSKFKDRRLQISWHKPKVPSVSTETEEEEVKEEETETSDLFLHDDDDEDEDEYESRSWRR
ncbi:RNA-binding protein 27 isoform X2 [Tachyglossus aculeatus]|uniref:RNA-binding protein 27 isoform X2 n=1 Tax=Tachyglossus aculeatus TaxID=9261 RepID=UPI0018F5B91B|nr:RNA-binding protein 27 isoform X2 [Tachyglossus aculeatus]